MKHKIVFVIFLLLGINASGQSAWEFKSDIVNNDYFLFEGEIDGKYPITMYLTLTESFCGKLSNNNWNARGVKGWYEYHKFRKKIPLIGSVYLGDGADYFIMVFVPINLLDTIDAKSCELGNYKELFHAEDRYFLDKIIWKKKGQESFPVTLKESHTLTWETKAAVSLEIRGVEMTTLDLSEMTGVRYIQSLEILAQKEIDNNFYSIIQFGHMTKPGSGGSGNCGSGYEKYLGFIHINSMLELESFKFYQTESCSKNIYSNQYSFDKEHIEHGIKERK